MDNSSSYFESLLMNYIHDFYLQQLFALQSMEKANEIITANQLQYTPQIDDKGHTLEQYSYDHFRYLFL